MTRLRFLAAATLFALAACRGETPAADQTATTATTPPPVSNPAATHSAAAPPPAPTRISSSTRCAGDGSYEKGVDCLRIASRLGFVYEEALIRAEGELSRPRPGMEKVTFRTSGSEWSGEAKATGLVWTHDGKHDANPPSFADRIYQRVATYVDPEKKEETAKLTGKEQVNGETIRMYRFTNSATGATSEVWVSERDGRIVRIKSTPLPQLADSSPEYTLDVR